MYLNRKQHGSMVEKRINETKIYTILPQIMAQVLISFQQLFAPVTKRDRQLYETGIYSLKF